jgi:hypothetical protein
MPPAEMIGSRVDELSLTAPDERQARWDGLLRDGSVAGEAAVSQGHRRKGRGGI